jgi:hypothetical protein
MSNSAQEMWSRVSKVRRSANSVRLTARRIVWMPSKRDLDRISVARDPIVDLRGGIDAGFDAAVAFLDRGLRDEFLRRRGFEIGFDFRFQRRLIAL